MIIPRAPGNVDDGGKLYQKDRAACHAKDGMGRGKFPRLVGQYTAYLKKQIDAFVKGEGRTPLHMAAFATRTAKAKLLLRAGADPHAKTEAGRDVLSMARKVRADELAGEVSLRTLKGFSKDKPC